MNPICLLETHIVNQIAAGEVVERPASVLKELVENAIDARSSSVKIRWRQGGQSSIEVDDNGHGIAYDQIRLALARHATSKLQAVSDLRSIHTFGFRGEALAAMTSIARVTLTTRDAQDSHGWTIYSEAGEEKYLQPAAREKGTCVAVQDLFFSTPARLKFMRSIQLEQSYLWDVVYKMALSHPHVHLHVTTDTRTVDIPVGWAKRLSIILGQEFDVNSVAMETPPQPYGLRGNLSLPTYHRAQADKLYISVNGRSISDKMLLMAVRLAYGDTLPKGRYPVGWLSLQIPHEEVDVNVHPAKTEVRFVNPGGIKTWLQSTIHQFLWTRGVKAAGWHMAVTHEPLDNEHGTETHSLVTTPVHSVMSPARDMGHPLRMLKGRDCHHLSTESSQRLIQSSSFADQKTQDGLRLHFEPHSAIPSPTCGQPNHSAFITSTPVATETTMVEPVPTKPSSSHLHVLEPVDLGQAVAQIHHRYIVAKTASHLIIVDQHAAHERIVYEYIKTQWGQDLGHISPFLIPTQWDQDPALCDMIHQSQDILHTLGFTAEVRQDIVLLHSIPMIFQAYDPKELFLDLMSCIVEGDDAFKALERWRNHILANWACRHSIRGGDAMSIPSMNALLRKLEVTPNGAQCNHGRCVYRQWNSSGLSLFFQ